MKYPNRDHLIRNMKFLPSFLILTECRTVERCMEFTTLSQTIFIQTIEGFLFHMINMADPAAMDDHKYCRKDYFVRRIKLLKALGLTEYMNEVLWMTERDLSKLTSAN